MILFCIPTQWIGWVFGNEFIESKKIIYALGCGIVVLSCNIILSHYFSGFGKYKINAIASLTGLIVTAGLSIAFIFGTNKELFSGMDIIFIMGLITSFSYLSSFVCTLIYFVKDTGLKPKELKITRQDISIVKTEIKKKIRKHFMGYRS
jgi:Na+-driven multidrug efflux pump